MENSCLIPPHEQSNSILCFTFVSLSSSLSFFLSLSLQFCTIKHPPFSGAVSFCLGGREAPHVPGKPTCATPLHKARARRTTWEIFGSQGVPQWDFQPIGGVFLRKTYWPCKSPRTLETHLGFDIYSFFGGDGVYKYVYMKGTWKHDFIEGVHYLFTKIGKESWPDVIEYSFFDGDSCQRLAILGQALVSIGPSALFVENPQNKHKLVRPKFVFHFCFCHLVIFTDFLQEHHGTCDETYHTPSVPHRT